MTRQELLRCIEDVVAITTPKGFRSKVVGGFEKPHDDISIVVFTNDSPEGGRICSKEIPDTMLKRWEHTDETDAWHRTVIGVVTWCVSEIKDFELAT